MPARATKTRIECDSGHSDPDTTLPTIAPMERLLLLWDEIDDLVGTSRYYVKNTAMAFWSSVRNR